MTFKTDTIHHLSCVIKACVLKTYRQDKQQLRDCLLYHISKFITILQLLFILEH